MVASQCIAQNENQLIYKLVLSLNVMALFACKTEENPKEKKTERKDSLMLHGTMTQPKKKKYNGIKTMHSLQS